VAEPFLHNDAKQQRAICVIWPNRGQFCTAHTKPKLFSFNSEPGLYEFFINHLRHPYALSPILPMSMIDPYHTKSGLPSQRNLDCRGSRVNGQRQPEEDGMKALTFIQTNSLAGAGSKSAGRQLTAKMQIVGTVAGLAGGVGSGLLGALLIAAGWFVQNKGVQQWLSIAGSVLLCLTIPLIILGAFCMDWLEKDKPRRYSKVSRDDDDDDDGR
jgi:hypothetical protein